MKTSGPFHREDSSAPSTPTAPPSSAVGVTSPEILAWLLTHARRDGERGNLPAGFPAWLRTLLTPIADTGNTGRPNETVEERKGQAVGQVADTTGLSPRTIRHLARSGQIRARRIGQRTWEIDPSSVTAYLQKRNP